MTVLIGSIIAAVIVWTATDVGLYFWDNRGK
jgi:hypothetical protein